MSQVADQLRANVYGSSIERYSKLKLKIIIRK
jgi:hypothetical protein